MNDLIPVFKPSNPDKVIYADQGQINSMPGKLIKVSDREVWLRQSKAKAAGSARRANAGPSEDDAQPPAGASQANTAPADPKPPARTKAELLKLCEEKGIAVTSRMTVEQLEKVLASVK